MKKKDLAVIVVLYDCKPEKSSSYVNLINMADKNNGLEVVFWNNGPESISLEGEGENVSLIQTLDNISLAKIYNKFITLFDSKRYLLLDHDTYVSNTYLESLCMSEFNYISIPNVKTNDTILYPIFKRINLPWNKAKCIFQGRYELDKKGMLLSIGSGICLNEKVLPLIKAEYNDVFDERFYIYGVDTSFFIRLNKIKNANIVIENVIEHSLSRVEEKFLSSFRLKERAVENVLMFRFYPSLFTLTRALKFLLSNRSSLNKEDILFLFKCYLKGVHPTNE